MTTATAEYIDANDVEQIVDRLKAESQGDMQQGEAAGLDCAKLWAIQAADLKHLKGFGDARENGYPDDFVGVWEFLASEYDAWFDAEYQTDLLKKSSDDDAFKDGFMRGFLNGVSQIWDKVKAAI